MAVRIRLSKVGKKHQISFRIVAQDTKTKRDGKFIEALGFWNPHKKPPEDFSVNPQRLNYWISKGAKPTLSVNKLIKLSGI
ncbi:30S ribosomal protein S16 [Candidatus Curtissbacteria bacterium RIFCSPHIGHO2_12_FULL_38_9b]|uniref:Small ribosomal subunit protein bS16 n=2 Tax=Candidatus Curtissiibacteriota TaxID=1752717 RepID=A0A1F5GXZ6_9BACT|nr:MAG: 30S ribosomal protein S16 [Candidatus Curtissbacteria bacterium RIFCSPLOWO2_01_FULL_37_9]OGD96753.1 MAG: 30S ribosomal protein S16 [Candidatus Curtissbacteria bacterium RIFCSPHIGHO2_12_FULL_38_9b]